MSISGTRLSIGLQYVLKEHHATRPHWDLRLQFRRTLLSWALPLGPSCFLEDEREAIEMEDHQLENILFEGVHKTGPVMVWDLGSWQPHADSTDILASLQKGLLRFTIYGQRLGGAWELFRPESAKFGYRSKWVLRKEADEFSANRGDKCILQRWRNSILKPERSMEQIVEYWKNPAAARTRQTTLFD